MYAKMLSKKQSYKEKRKKELLAEKFREREKRKREEEEVANEGEFIDFNITLFLPPAKRGRGQCPEDGDPEVEQDERDNSEETEGRWG